MKANPAKIITTQSLCGTDYLSMRGNRHRSFIAAIAARASEVRTEKHSSSEDCRTRCQKHKMARFCGLFFRR